MNLICNFLIFCAKLEFFWLVRVNNLDIFIHLHHQFKA